MSPEETVGRLLLAIALAIGVGQLLAHVLTRLRQPTVLAQITAGFVLGPSLVGAIPGASELLFPGPVQQALSAAGSIGLVLFMFVVGLELDLSAVREQKRRTVAVSLGAMGLPFVLGLAVATLVYEAHRHVGGEVVGRLPFSLFVATALCVTAFPVLARIVRDHRLERTAPAQLATASAAVQDGVGWLLLAIALAAMSADGPSQLIEIVVGSVVLAAVLAIVVRPLLRRRCDTGVLLVALFACAGAAQLIGLHSVLGAFLLGAAIPREQRARASKGFAEAVMPATTTILLPIYFLGPGLHVDLRAIGVGGLGELALIMACACGGKLLGAGVPALLTGSSRREATMVAVLLNTRGLMELVVLEVGRSEGILDPALFSVLMMVALATTLMTGPLLHVLERTPGRRRRGGVGEPALAEVARS